MAIKYIDTSAKEIKAKTPSRRATNLRFILKTAFLTIAGTVGLLVVFCLLLAIILYPKVSGLSSQLHTAYNQGKALESSFKTKDFKAVEKNLAELKKQTKIIRDDFNGLSFVRFIPILASYYSDGEHMLNVADITLNFGSKTLTTIEPYADVLGFKGAETSPGFTAEEKTQRIIKDMLPKLTPLVDEATTQIRTVEDQLSSVDPGRYPSGLTVAGLPVRESLKLAKKYLDQADNFLPQVKPLLLAAPEISGIGTPRTYLLLLQNDKELRPTGGFITSYGLATVKDGKLDKINTDDIYQLDLKYTPTIISPEAERKYVGWSMLPIRDSNLSPDYKTAAMLFENMYNTIKGVPKVDGVIALDTEFVRTFLEATGPITSPKSKMVFSAANNRLGIPDVVYKLELEAEIIQQSQPGRKGILGDLMNGLLDKILGAKPEELPKYVSTFIDTVTRKHVLFYFHNSSVQNFVEKYNAAGKIVLDYPNDYFHLNNANFGGLKGNLYIKQAVTQNITISDDGTVTKSVDVTLTNPVKADGWLNSIYLNWMRIYVPEGSKLISEKVQKDFTSGVEFNKEVYRGYGATYPLHSSTFNFTYKLPFKVHPGSVYKMLIQKQPGVDETHMLIKVNGITKEDFLLNTDKEISFRV